MIMKDFGIHVGDQIGSLIVVDLLDDYVTPEGVHRDQYLCQCTCDNHTMVAADGAEIRMGVTRHCGCSALHYEGRHYIPLTTEKATPSSHVCADTIEKHTEPPHMKSYEFNGDSFSRTEWSIAMGYSRDAVRDRLDRHWTVEEAILGKKDCPYRMPHNLVYFLNEKGRPFKDQILYQNGTKDPIPYTYIPPVEKKVVGPKRKRGRPRKIEVQNG